MAVWDSLRDIPPAQTCTYGELAGRLRSSPRAVGGALRANPIPILIPCHRVVGARGLGGYAGASAEGQARKRWLLAHEGAALKFDGSPSI
ncbi:MAG: methylated-DNA--[protein]-cysteine S-methyltransferase [Pseudomonadota bacterium]